MQNGKSEKQKKKKNPVHFLSAARIGKSISPNTVPFSRMKRHLLSQTLGISEETIQVCMCIKMELKTCTVNPYNTYAQTTA